MARRSRSVSVALVRALAQVAERGGSSPDEFLRASYLSAADLSRPEARVAEVKYERALSLAERVVAPEPERPEIIACVERGLPVLAASWLNAPTLSAALEAFTTFLPLLSETDHVRIHGGHEHFVAEHRTDLPQSHAAYAAIGCFLLLVHIVRSYQSGSQVRFWTELKEGAHRWGSGLEAFLQGRVIPAQRSSLLHVSGVDLEAHHEGFNPSLEPLVAQYLAASLCALQRDESTSLFVERGLTAGGWLGATGWGAGRSAIDAICCELRISRWTLNRRLAAEGTSFQTLRFRARLSEAKRLLEDTDTPVQEIGERLGFASRAAFAHFFQRATGFTPARWRAAAAG